MGLTQIPNQMPETEQVSWLDVGCLSVGQVVLGGEMEGAVRPSCGVENWRSRSKNGWGRLQFSDDIRSDGERLRVLLQPGICLLILFCEAILDR